MKQLLLTINGNQPTTDEINNMIISNLIEDYIDSLYENGHISERPSFTLEEYDGDKISKIESIVIENYSSEKCGATSEWSHGNSDDVFSDGENFGRSWLAHEIGTVLEMDLEEPEEQKYSWED